jgi:hypothetical protein
MYVRATMVFLGSAVLLVTVVLLGGVAVWKKLHNDPLHDAMLQLRQLGFVPTHILDIGANTGAWTAQMQQWQPGLLTQGAPVEDALDLSG